jgi:hypothetical protein
MQEYRFHSGAWSCKKNVFFIPTFDLREFKTILTIIVVPIIFFAIVYRVFTIIYLKQTMFEGIQGC